MTGQEEPALLWHVFPLGLLGADQSGADRTCRGSLRELVEWLPHLTSLGADGLLLGPVFASVSHGYDTVSHRTIDDRLGGVGDFDALVAAASAHGVGVVLDGVFAYASRAFWRLADPAELGDPWFVRDHQGGLVPWRVDSLVTPDYDSAGYQSYVAEVMASWLDRGVAGWRLDSAWSVPASECFPRPPKVRGCLVAPDQTRARVLEPGQGRQVGGERRFASQPTAQRVRRPPRPLGRR